MKIDEVEQLLEKLRDAERADIDARVAKAQRERQAAASATEAERAERRRHWWEQQKMSRLKCYVPAGRTVSHVVFGGARSWTDFEGNYNRGEECIPVETDVSGRPVVYLRSIGDFTTLVNNGTDGLAWEMANPDLMRERAEIGPRNHPSIPEAPSRPY
ncbi:hypothetical protein [Bradyrhizobium sp. HKCCYLS3013]|uniref:hypothetical protein n=1 Tax=Bradyrhizobium sp. HKCCYLS3013 TaxID=3420735 RepID=UPI003EB72E76